MGLEMLPSDWLLANRKIRTLCDGLPAMLTNFGIRNLMQKFVLDANAGLAMTHVRILAKVLFVVGSRYTKE